MHILRTNMAYKFFVCEAYRMFTMYVHSIVEFGFVVCYSIVYIYVLFHSVSSCCIYPYSTPLQLGQS